MPEHEFSVLHLGEKALRADAGVEGAQFCARRGGLGQRIELLGEGLHVFDGDAQQPIEAVGLVHGAYQVAVAELVT